MRDISAPYEGFGVLVTDVLVRKLMTLDRGRESGIGAGEGD